MLVDVNRPGTILGVYVQDEVRVFPWLLLNAGARVDRYPTFGSRATPRVGLVLLPRPQTAIKVLLRPRVPRAECLRAVLLQRADAGARPRARGRCGTPKWCGRNTSLDRVRTAVTAFSYRADSIIEQGSFDERRGTELYFSERGRRRRSRPRSGSGDQAGRRPERALQPHVRSHARPDHHAAVSNSPRHLSKLGVQIPDRLLLRRRRRAICRRASDARRRAADRLLRRRTSR